MVYFICIYSKEPLRSNTTKFNMFKYEDKHSLSLSQETTKACPSLKTKSYLLIKVKWIYMPSLFSFDLVHGRSILCLLIFSAISLCLNLWCEASFKSTKTYFIVCLLEKKFFQSLGSDMRGKGLTENSDKWSQGGGGPKNAIFTVTLI